MATSQSHKLGEFIGAFFEDLMKSPIREFANKCGLYFDAGGSRKARGGKKLTWTDVHGSKHDLDFVLEKNGSEDSIGEPVAFIELAWRRYVKHSKNKVQEISGAVDPICEKYKFNKPFKGAILSGEFTKNSLDQLKKDGFHLLYIPYTTLVDAFKAYGLDIDFGEDTKESDLRKKYVAVSQKKSKPLLEKIRNKLLKECEAEIKRFVSELSASYNRKIKNICILPLHGKRTNVISVGKAIAFINGYSSFPSHLPLAYVEVVVTYNNGTIVQGQFKEKEEAIEFLERIQ